MANLEITVWNTIRKELVEIELSDETLISRAISFFREQYNLPDCDTNGKVLIYIFKNNEKILKETQTFSEAKVKTGDTLYFCQTSSIPLRLLIDFQKINYANITQVIISRFHLFAFSLKKKEPKSLVISFLCIVLIIGSCSKYNEIIKTDNTKNIATEHEKEEKPKHGAKPQIEFSLSPVPTQKSPDQETADVMIFTISNLHNPEMGEFLFDDLCSYTIDAASPHTQKIFLTIRDGVKRICSIRRGESDDRLDAMIKGFNSGLNAADIGNAISESTDSDFLGAAVAIASLAINIHQINKEVEEKRNAAVNEIINQLSEELKTYFRSNPSIEKSGESPASIFLGFCNGRYEPISTEVKIKLLTTTIREWPKTKRSNDIISNKLHEFLIHWLNEGGRWDDARTVSNILLSKWPNNASSHVYVGMEIYYTGGNKAKAIECFSKAAQMEPNNWRPCWWAFYVSAAAKNEQKATDWLCSAIQRGYKDYHTDFANTSLAISNTSHWRSFKTPNVTWYIDEGLFAYGFHIVNNSPYPLTNVRVNPGIRNWRSSLTIERIEANSEHEWWEKGTPQKQYPHTVTLNCTQATNESISVKER